MHDLKDKVAASLTRYSMLSPGDRVGVAVSGGADSVTLLHLLHGFSLYKIVLLHVNHGLRGVESEADELFVRELAHRLGLPLEVNRAPVTPGNLEQQARDGRRAFFAEARVSLNLQAIALGHNRSDQAETVLYRFVRGSGLAGLAGMLPVTADGIIRPMLDATREEIRQWATEQGITWREDSSNQNLDFVRNRLRLEVFNPQLVRVLSATAEVARAEEKWWSAHIAALYASHVKRNGLGVEFQVTAICALHVAEQRRLIRFAIKELKGNLRSIDFAHVEAIRNLLRSEAGHDRVLVPGADALRSFGTLLLALPGALGNAPRHYRVNAEIGKELALPYDAGRLYVNQVKLEDGFCGNFGVEQHFIPEVVDLDGEILGKAQLDSWQIRNWEPGDEYRRAGHEKSEKIKSLFQEYRILLWERRRWPVLVLGDEIIWSPRFGAAAKFQATDASRDIVRLIYTANGSATA